MLIICPHCATSYQVEEAAVGPAGRSVRCARCRTVWFAANTGALSDIAAAHRVEMAQFATPDSPPDAPPAAQPGEGLAAGAAEEKAPTPAPPTDAAFAAAELTVVDDAPSIVENDPGEALAAPMASELDRPVVTVEATATTDSGGADVETIAARRFRTGTKRRRKASRLPGQPTIILMLVALDLGLIGW